jgi:hypothetical protein
MPSSPSTTGITTPSELTPATAKAGTAELLACLTLVAPTGMSAEDRNAWVAVAKATLSGIPADLLALGCKKARETCRFASEVVPTIIAHTKAIWDGRKNRFELERLAWENRHAPRLESNPDYVNPEQVRELIQSLGKGG